MELKTDLIVGSVATVLLTSLINITQWGIAALPLLRPRGFLNLKILCMHNYYHIFVVMLFITTI
jgi:hypothetical protein